eukprot:scaffold17722_cov121-Isochrysis_galbana.AAC.3
MYVAYLTSAMVGFLGSLAERERGEAPWVLENGGEVRPCPVADHLLGLGEGAHGCPRAAEVGESFVGSRHSDRFPEKKIADPSDLNARVAMLAGVLVGGVLVDHGGALRAEPATDLNDGEGPTIGSGTRRTSWDNTVVLQQPVLVAGRDANVATTGR